MKKNLLTLLLMCFVAISSFAQQALWDRANVKSPEINADKSVTFRLFAPQAKEVMLTGDCVQGQKPVAMEKKGDVWEYTTPQLAPELYCYNFIIDGVKVNDPSNVYMIRDVNSVFNVFIIGGDRASLYEVKNVKHGSVSKVWYDSKVAGMSRRMTVYTPAGYEDGKQKYPVFYLLHGMGGDEEAWMDLGRTSQILDNLIAQGKAEPMIVVMTNGNIAMEAAPGQTSEGYKQPNFNLPKTMEGTFETHFPDVVKYIDTHYRTKTDKNHRAIAGLSMGGFHSLHISKQYPDMFGYVGLFSAAIMRDGKSEIYSDFEGKLKKQFSLKPSLYYIAIGKEDFLYKDNTNFRNLLDKNGYKYEYFESADGHIWKNWRIYLTEFAPKLFK